MQSKFASTHTEIATKNLILDTQRLTQTQTQTHIVVVVVFVTIHNLHLCWMFVCCLLFVQLSLYLSLLSVDNICGQSIAATLTHDDKWQNNKQSLHFTAEQANKRRRKVCSYCSCVCVVYKYIVLLKLCHCNFVSIKREKETVANESLHFIVQFTVCAVCGVHKAIISWYNKVAQQQLIRPTITSCKLPTKVSYCCTQAKLLILL